MKDEWSKALKSVASSYNEKFFYKIWELFFLKKLPSSIEHILTKSFNILDWETYICWNEETIKKTYPVFLKIKKML